ncbi:hypothetical protein L208DRAFT_1259352 [Tricholoma matsutake]|nr:hypothetical protein L208DRAFT_1259352 [Tricholoma matsutake 945]
MLASRSPLTNFRILPPPIIRLPRVLTRPSSSEVASSNIAAASPELHNVPPEYIRESLLHLAPQLYHSLSNVKASPPKHTLPNELEIIINDTTCCPTHMLAVHSFSPQPNQTRQVTMYPTHHLVLASHCANLPALPPSLPSPSSSTPSTTTIPVISLSLPSPTTFPPLHAYLYTKDITNLFTTLLSPPNEHDDDLERQAALIYGVWSNAYVLGVVDEQLFDALDKAWEWVSAKLQLSS